MNTTLSPRRPLRNIGRYGAAACVGLIAAATIGTSVASAAPSESEATAKTSDGSSISWDVPSEATLQRSADATAQPTFQTSGSDNDVSTVITIPNAESPSEYRFPLTLPDGAGTEPQPDGSINILNSTGKPIGSFTAPWAKDSAGKAVPTSISIEEGVLIQKVDLSSTQSFPVTADPHYTWGIVTGTAYFNRYETQRIGSLGAVTGLAGAFLPPPFDALVITYGAALSLAASADYNNGHCVAINSVGVIREYWGGDGDGYCR
ncbi:hypothetical protein [Rhodococcoides fascians]|uniref:hypothetical protein n=1 Tax=Rhodococcoides fascians TaxID=1828 RepID=UPI000AAA6EC5|nr:hypothetical protein [Rhodococcus fascians]